jgi:hypothetical protein
MATDMGLVLEALRHEIGSLPERRPGYRREVLATVADIVGFEREHAEVKISIVRRVTDKTEALARLVGSGEATE